MRLFLIRHAMPVIDTSLPPAEWPISNEGRSAARKLARKLSHRSIAEIVSSVEPKSAETAREIAGVLGVPMRLHLNLHEHERPAMEWHGSEDAWNALIQQLFSNPDQLIFGHETASQALRRFAAAVSDLQESAGIETEAIGIVSHGTVMSLFVAETKQTDPYEIWRKLELPDVIELDLA